MGSTYRPDPAAIPVPPWSIAILSQRDLEVQIPINYITYPGVSLLAACFNNFVYSEEGAAKCFSNLLIMGFRKFDIDIYWDPTRRVWSLCPVQISTAVVSSSTSSSSTTASSTSAASGRPAKRNLQERQATTATTLIVGTQSPSSTAAMAQGTQNLIRNGQYSCSTSLNLNTIAVIVAEYLRQTSTNLNARMSYLNLNLHSYSNGTGDEDASRLPRAPEQLNAVLADLTDDLYTPTILRTDRQNLNASWLGSTSNSKPDLKYLTTNLNSNNHLVTSNGWPSEGLVEFSKRVVISIGSIDSQLRSYDTARDFELYHRVSSMTQLPKVLYNSTGALSEGCFYDATSTTISTTNNSWAIATDFTLSGINSTSPSYLPSIQGLTSCGISPFLNTSIPQTSAETNLIPFQSISYSSIWSWAFNEPRNVSSSEPNPNRIRCAAMDLNLAGHWRIADCADQHLGACRVGDSPYEWRISMDKGSYSSQVQACPSNSTFAVPRTGLENTYLHRAFLQARSRNSEAGEESLIWLNFNSLDTASCWVQGVKTACPYGPNALDSGSNRQVIIPIVAAIIVLVIAALLVFVKCAANRRNTKRGRRRKGKDDAYEYEGVPS